MFVTFKHWGVPAILGGLLGVFCTSSALAQEPESPAALFEAARTLVAGGKLEVACPMFKRSLELEPSAGTALNLADCHARQGKNTDAYREFQQAAELARKEQWNELAVEADRRAKELEATFPKITVQVPVPVDGLVIRHGDRPVDMQALGKPKSVPPGTYSIEASAPGYQKWSMKVTLSDGDQVVTVPILQPTAPTSEQKAEPAKVVAPTAVSVAVPVSSPPPVDHTLSWALMGGGGVLVLGSVITGVMANGKLSELDRACGNADPCSSTHEPLYDSAETLALTTDILWVGGAALAAAGVTLWVLSEQDGKKEHLAVTPAVALGQLGLLAQGSF